jgi:transposase InsO family protein
LQESIKERIKEEYSIMPYCALKMEKLLRKKGLKVSHNKIHEVLKEGKLAKDEPKKKNQRKWVRYERKKANSLWHTDWTELDGKQLILFEDDATRLIIGYGFFENATAERSLQVFAVAVSRYGIPRQLLTDNGSQFCNTHDNKDLNHLFHGNVMKAGCEHIFTRVNHPQTNGKLERLNYTISQLYFHYGKDIDKAVKMYNEERIHMSLGNGWLTPLEAWNKKLKKGLKYENVTKI